MMKKILRQILLIMLLAVPAALSAQSDRDYIRTGNKAFRQKNYPQAEIQYRKALSANGENPQALYNLGCALMMQNKMQDAVKMYQKAASVETGKLRKAMIFHNIGVICQSGKMYGEAIKAYSESLRNNPHDNQTRYNLALCKKLQKSEGKNNKQQKQKQDKQKDKKEDKQNKQQGKPENDKQDKSDQNKQPQMSKDNAEQLLNAAMQQEEQTQQKLSKNRQQQQTRHLEKNW